MPEEKALLRNMLRERRWSLTRSERIDLSRRVCRHLKGVISEDETVMVYCAKEPEVETEWVIDMLLNVRVPVIVPIIQSKDRSLRLSYLKSRDHLIPSTFQVPEPVGAEIPADPGDITTAIIPMLGFDKKGGRVGYGAGYYDRFLCKSTHIRMVGVAYSCQEIPDIPVQEHDISMDLIVTEDGVLDCRRFCQ